MQVFSFLLVDRHPRRLPTKTNRLLGLRTGFDPATLSLSLSFSLPSSFHVLFFPLRPLSLFSLFPFPPSFLFVLPVFFLSALDSTDKVHTWRARIKSNAFTRARKIRTTGNRATNGLFCSTNERESAVSREIHRQVRISRGRFASLDTPTRRWSNVEGCARAKGRERFVPMEIFQWLSSADSSFTSTLYGRRIFLLALPITRNIKYLRFEKEFF